MTDDYVPPGDVQASDVDHGITEDLERALVGAALLAPDALDDVLPVLMPEDFSVARYGAIYGVLRERLSHGASTDWVELASTPGSSWPMTLAETSHLANEVFSVSSIPTYARQIVEQSRRRRIYRRALGVVEHVGTHNTTSADELLADLAAIPADDACGPRDKSGPSVELLSEFLDRARQPSEFTEWISPGMIRRGWRIVLIGEEGVGKMVLLRQIAQHVAAGYDPFTTQRRIEPRRVLVIDAENTDSTKLHQIELISHQIDFGDECGDRLGIMSVEYGIDMLSRVGRMQVERAVRKFRPDLLIAGPLYKLFRKDPRGDLETTTMSFLETIDDLRRRYGMAIILEHHMPKAQGGRDRNSDPAGSSVLMRWPEIGLAIRRKKKDAAAGTGGQAYDLTRFRGSRENELWPVEIIQRDTAIGTAPAWSGRWAQRRLDEPEF